MRHHFVWFLNVSGFWASGYWIFTMYIQLSCLLLTSVVKIHAGCDWLDCWTIVIKATNVTKNFGQLLPLSKFMLSPLYQPRKKPSFLKKLMNKRLLRNDHFLLLLTKRTSLNLNCVHTTDFKIYNKYVWEHVWSSFWMPHLPRPFYT
jgi:hypothetical protein